MARALIRNGTVLTDTRRAVADVFVEDGVISRIGPHLPLHADSVVDASGLLVMPGGLDAHTHLDMPAGEIRSTDDFETGTIAAAHGGTTTIIDFATPEPGESLLAALDVWKGKAAGRPSWTTPFTWCFGTSASGPHPKSTSSPAAKASPRSRCSWPIPAG
jgi:dihydropyrimidinase